MNGAIVGLGTDIVNVPRVARLARLHGNRFLKYAVSMSLPHFPAYTRWCALV